jgi:MFS family permease
MQPAISKRSGLTLAIVSVALFMVTLDNLVVTNALVSIREDLGASLEQLEWTVNAYTLSYAVFLLTAAALGDRFGRRRVFAIGIGGARPEHGCADRGPGVPGPRRGGHHPAVPDSPQ